MQSIWTPPFRNAGIKVGTNSDCFFQGVEAATVIARHMAVNAATETDLEFARPDAIDPRRQGRHFRLRSQVRGIANGKNASASQTNKQCLNSRQGYRKMRRDIGHGAALKIHRCRLGLINLVGMMSGAKSEVADRDTLQAVLLVCGPFKVFEAVIRLGRVFVVHHVLFTRGRSEERQRDQSVDCDCPALAIAAKTNGWIAGDMILISDFAVLAHAAHIADFVSLKSRIKNHSHPSLCAHAFHPHSIADAA